MLRSASKLKLCGAIFDAPAKMRQLGKLEAEIGGARERAQAAALEDVVALGVADEHAGPIPVH